MTIENLPEWVPDAARRLVATVHIDNPFLQRFLRDPRIEAVWKVLKQEQPVSGGIRAADPERMISCIDFDFNERPSEIDYACAAFCWAVVKTTGDTYDGKPIARIETHLNKIAKPYEEIVEKCDFLKKNEDFWGIPLTQDLIDAIDKVADHAIRRASLIKQQDKPFLLKRSSKDRGDADAVRAWTLRIAYDMFSIWGKLFYSSLATIAEVLFELEHDPERRDAVKKWCQDLSGNKRIS